MSSLTQQIIELKSQLRCIQENMEQWNDDECLQGIKMIILKLKEGLREVVVFEKIYNHLSSKFDKSQKKAQRLSELRQWYFDEYNSHELTIEILKETQTQLESIIGLAITLEWNDKDWMIEVIIDIVGKLKRS